MNREETNKAALEKLAKAEEQYWQNPDVLHWSEARETLSFGEKDIEDARARLERFAPLIVRLFPETANTKGIIESPLKEIPSMQDALGKSGGKLLLKCDSHLPIAGSVKARGGIYEVLKHTEELALGEGLITESSGAEEYAALADHRDFFSHYKMQVGSTGNLGMSIGIMSAAIGYQAIVHMSADAKEWKKKLLRSKGVTVIEYADDYSRAVMEGRRLSDEDAMSYFVDDESSSALYLGYAVAGKRLKKQLEGMNITIGKDRPLVVYIPCGVGGAPGGICFGIKQCFGDDASVYFAEPTLCPCMLAAFASGKGSGVCVKDYGLSGKTEADGLAVGRASALVYKEMLHLLEGEVTNDDHRLYEYMQMLNKTEGIIIEPSACAPFRAYEVASEKFAQKHPDIAENAVHVVWATGGSLMPEEIVKDYLSR